MRPTEVVMLTGYLRAHFPSQPVDEYTTEALGELLAPYAATGTGFYPPIMLVVEDEQLAKLRPLINAAVASARRAAS